MNLGGIVNSFRVSGGLEVTRRGANTLTDGIYTAGSSSTLMLDPAIAYPATPRELRLVPEGQRSQEAFAFVTRDRLRGIADPSGAPADRVTYSGVIYEIQAVTNWYGFGYYLAVGTKVPLT